MFRWLTHKHDLALVAETYAPPLEDNLEMRGAGSLAAGERASHGCTTLVWKCSDPACGKVVAQVALGKRLER